MPHIGSLESSNCCVIDIVMGKVDMDCHISAVFWRHVIASVIVMVTVDTDRHISAVKSDHVIASVMVMVDIECHTSAVWVDM